VTHDQGTDHDARAHDEPAALIERDRAAKDAFFRSSPRGPIPARARPGFRGLSYYPVDLAFRFEGIRLDPYSGSGLSTFEIPTSDGQLRPARRVGSLHFELDAVVHALTAYDLSGGHDHSLFVPFLDATSGTKTYGAGRYLLDTAKGADLGVDAHSALILDFNFAYQPSCAFDPRWACPLAPPEARLALAVEAGERIR